MDVPVHILLRGADNRVMARLDGTDAATGWSGLEVRKAWNAPGLVLLRLTGDHAAVPLLTPDIRVDVWRNNRRELIGLVGDYTHEQDSAGQHTWTYPCLGPLSLLDRAQVHWSAGDDGRSSWDATPTESIIVDLINWNLTFVGNEDRLIDPPRLAIVDVTSDGRGTARTYRAHGDIVLEAVQQLARLEGATIDVELIDEDSELAAVAYRWLPTYAPPRTQRGVVFSVDRGNIREAQLDVRRATAPTHAVVWGPGEGADRKVVTRTSPYVTSPPREVYVDARNVKLEDANWLTQLEQAGDDVLYEERPIEVFRFQPYGAPNAVYGVDWECGDLVTVVFDGRTFIHRITGVTFSYDDGMETIEIESETA